MYLNILLEAEKSQIQVFLSNIQTKFHPETPS